MTISSETAPSRRELGRPKMARLLRPALGRLSGPAMVRRILLPAVIPAYIILLRSGLGLE
jgi:hypothetical protein